MKRKKLTSIRCAGCCEFCMPVGFVDGVPILPAYEERGQWKVRCCECTEWHPHSKEESGHRVAHCSDRESRYKETGYFILFVGPMTAEIKRLHGRGAGRNSLVEAAILSLEIRNEGRRFFEEIRANAMRILTDSSDEVEQAQALELVARCDENLGGAGIQLSESERSKARNRVASRLKKAQHAIEDHCSSAAMLKLKKHRTDEENDELMEHLERGTKLLNWAIGTTNEYPYQ